MPPKRKQKKGNHIVFNFALEAELIRLGVNRDAVISMTREQQSAELDRLEGLVPRTIEETFAQTYTDNQQAAAAAAAASMVANPPPSALPAPAIPPPATPAVEAATENPQGPHAPLPTQSADDGDHSGNANAGGTAQDDYPMNIDGPELTGIGLYNNRTGHNPWLLQQPMQPPIAARRADEPWPQLLGPLPAEIQRTISEESDMHAQRQLLEAAVNDQWNYLMAPPPAPIEIPLMGPLQSDFQRMYAYLPPHLQAIVSAMPVFLQQSFALEPPHFQMSHLYQRYTEHRQHLEQQLANRAQIDTDPLLHTLPELRTWLHNTSLPLQTRWINSVHPDRMEILRENGLLTWMQDCSVAHHQRLVAYAPQQVPDRLLAAEDMARYNAGFGFNYFAWLISPERAAWYEGLRQTGQL